MPSSYNPPSGGGSSIPQLPIWTFDAGTGANPASGKFQLSNADPSLSNTLWLNITPKNGGLDSTGLFTYGARTGMVILTSSTGKSYMYQYTAVPTELLGVITVAMSVGIADSTILSGDYTFSFAPQNPLVVWSLDSGYTANADVGDKSAVIPDNATISAMQGALNVVVPGFGDAFVATADKVKAIESSLAQSFQPNA